MCKSNTNTSAPATGVAKKSWADIYDDDASELTASPGANGVVGKSSSSTSTPATASPKQSWADMSEDDISEGETLAMPLEKAKQCRNRADSVSAERKKDVNVLSDNCEQSFADIKGIPVEVIGMPPKLCNKMFLDTIIEQIGVEDHVCGQQIRQESGGAIVTIKFDSQDAAVQCCRHFETSSWSTGGLKVSKGVSTMAPEAACESGPTSTMGSPALHPTVVGGWQTFGNKQQFTNGMAWQTNGSQWNVPAAQFGGQWAYPWSSQQGLCDAWENSYVTGSFAANPMPYGADSSAHEMALARAYANARGN